MTKNELRKTGYRRIIKEGQTHQEAYEELKDTPGLDRDMVATELSKFPSKAKREQNKVLKGVFVGVLGLIIVLRALGLIVVEQNMNGMFLLLLVVLGILAPGFAILAVLQNKPEALRGLGFLFIVGILRSLQHVDLVDPLILVGIIPYVFAIVLAFWLPERMKTPFKRTMARETDAAGVEHTKVQIVFVGEPLSQNGELLDAEL